MNLTYKKIIIPGLKEKYTFLHITDRHLISPCEWSTEEERKHVRSRKAYFAADGKECALDLEQIVSFANAAKVSGVLLTGDILDFSYAENIQALECALHALQMPYVYVTGNHDWSYFDHTLTDEEIQNNRQKLRIFCEGDEAFHVVKIGELTFAAVDNSGDRYCPGTAEKLQKLLREEEHVIVLQHIPLYCKTLHEDTVNFWGEDLCLGTPAIVRDESADKVKSILTTCSTAKAVICGHLHFEHEDLIEGTLPQFITACAAQGNVGFFEVTGEE